MALSKKPTKGMKDILPEEMRIRDYVIGVIKETYGKFGFTSIETPCVENIANLSSKQGGEAGGTISPLSSWECALLLRKSAMSASSGMMEYAETSSMTKKNCSKNEFFQRRYCNGKND